MDVKNTEIRCVYNKISWHSERLCDSFENRSLHFSSVPYHLFRVNDVLLIVEVASYIDESDNSSICSILNPIKVNAITTVSKSSVPLRVCRRSDSELFLLTHLVRNPHRDLRPCLHKRDNLACSHNLIV